MRRFLFAVAGSLAIPGCLVGTGDISTESGKDDDGSGTGPGGGQSGQSAVTATLDKAAISTELGKLETLTITVTGTNGFSGAVDVVPSVVNAAGEPVAGWQLTPTPASVNLPLDGSAQVQVAVSVPSDAAVLSPKIKVALKTALGSAPAEVSAAVTVAKQITIGLAATGTASPHAAWPAVGQTLTIRAGTKVVFHNADSIAHQMHGSGGILHEAGLLAPGGDYTVTPSANGQWWCHAHGEGSGAARSIKVIPASP